MPKNKTAAIEWMMHAYHDLNGAILLFEARHYTDTISYVLQQAIEKTLKAILAAQNRPIRKVHNLLEIYDLVMSDSFKLNTDDLMCLSIATTYYTRQKYPISHKKLPAMTEIENIIEFANRLFFYVLTYLNIDIEEVAK